MAKKSILITGCSTGIGLDAALTLSARGYQVFASARNDSDLNMLTGKGLNAVYLDLADSDSISQALNTVLAATDGRLDYLFNNGAYGQPGAIEDLPTSVLKAQFEVNVFGWHELTRQVLPIMRRQGHGRIIQNSSVLGFVCMPYRGAYNASKFAIEGLTDTLRLELRDSNIDVCLIEPGPIDTAFRKNALAAFENNVDWQQSEHKARYQKQLERLRDPKPSSRFTLHAHAVTQVLIDALESKKPKARYSVTFPTKLFVWLKRVLPTSWLDSILVKG